MALLVEAPLAVASLLLRAEEIPEIAMERHPGSKRPRRISAVVASRRRSASMLPCRSSRGETKSASRRPSASGPKKIGEGKRSAGADRPRKRRGRRREKRKIIGGVLR